MSYEETRLADAVQCHKPAAETPVSTLSAERIHKGTTGSASVQGIKLRARSETFSCRRNRSTILFAVGWYAVVRMCSMPRSRIRLAKGGKLTADHDP